MRTSSECEGVDKKKEDPALWSDRAAVEIFCLWDWISSYFMIPAPLPSKQRVENTSEKTVRNWLGVTGPLRSCWTPRSVFPQPVRSYRSYTWTQLPTNLLLLPRYHCLQECHYYYGYLASHQEQNTVFIFKNHYRLLRVGEGSSWTNFPNVLYGLF